MLKTIKIIHTLIWIVIVMAILYVVYAGVFNDINIYVWLSIGMVILEGFILLINKGSCPLTLIAKKHSSNYEVGDDIYLPKWLAIHNKSIFTTIFFIGILIVIFRIISN